MNVFIEPINYAGNQNTITRWDKLIFSQRQPLFNLKRLTKNTYDQEHLIKGVFDKVMKHYQTKKLKKISFEFSRISTDDNKDILESNIFLASGNKIAYSVELEATTNPELKEGISGSASLSHYNILNGVNI